MIMESKVYGYARVSSSTQNEDRQIVALREMGVPENHIYVDKMTGKDFNRPEYKKLLKKLDENSILYIKSIDRLGRNYNDLGEQWKIITKNKKSDVVVIDMPILDTRKEKNLLGTFISDLVLSLLSFCSEQEVSYIHMRQAEGIAATKARGVKMGRPTIPLPENFHETYQNWKSGMISTKAAAYHCRMPISTFRYKANRYGNEQAR